MGIDAIHGNPYDGHTLKASIGASDEDSRLAAEGSVLRQRVSGKWNNRGNNGKADKPEEKEREPVGMEILENITNPVKQFSGNRDNGFSFFHSGRKSVKCEH